MEIIKADIKELLRNCSRLHIPFYQRDYVWKKKEIYKFLEDIITSNTNEYFIGSIIFKNKNDDYKIVIDGQQRLTTIWLVLRALLNYKNNLNEKFFSSIEENFEYFKYDTKKLNKGEVLNKIIFEEEYSLTNEEKETNFYLAYLIIKNFFKTRVGKLNEFYEKFENVIVSKIVVDKNIDEHIIFSQINSTGKRLSAFDLIRNHLFSKIFYETENQKEFDKILKVFDDVTNATFLDEEKRDDIFRQFISFKTGILYTNDQDKIYNEFVNLFCSQDYDSIGLKFFKDFFPFAFIYKFIKKEFKNYSFKFNDILVFFESSFNTYIVLIAYIILLNSQIDNYKEIIINNEQEKNIYDFLLILEIYHIRREFCDFNKKTITRFIPKIVSIITKSMKELKENFDNKIADPKNMLYFLLYVKSNNNEKDLPTYRMPTPKEFNLAFQNYNIYQNSRLFCKSFLIRLATFNNKVQIDFDAFTIDHVLPQNLNKWRDDGYDEIEEEIIKKIDTIGNLTLTLNNASYSNETFLKKVNKMKEKESFVLNNYFFELQNWNLQEIENRSKYLLNLVNKNWDIFFVENLIDQNYNIFNSICNDQILDENDSRGEEILKNKSWFRNIGNVSYEDIKNILEKFFVNGISYENIEFDIFRMNFNGYVVMSIINFFNLDKQLKGKIQEDNFSKFIQENNKYAIEAVNYINEIRKY